MTARKVIAGKCGACSRYRHCARCVCCTDAPTNIAPIQGSGWSRTYAYVSTTSERDAHTVHYVKRSATHRIPDGGNVRLQWRDRLTVGVAHVGTRTDNPMVPYRFRVRDAMLAQAGHAHTL